MTNHPRQYFVTLFKNQTNSEVQNVYKHNNDIKLYQLVNIIDFLNTRYHVYNLLRVVLMLNIEFTGHVQTFKNNTKLHMS